MNGYISALRPYPFERLRQLLESCQLPGQQPINLALGEPGHPPPDFLVQQMTDIGQFMEELGRYPATRGRTELRQSIAHWIEGRYQLASGSLDPETQVLPVNGTREGLFSVAQALVSGRDKCLVMMPNPLYQIYEGAAILAGARPRYLACTENTGFLPLTETVTRDEWQACRLMYICNPGNPAGAVMSRAELIRLIELTDEFDFVLAADECYSEIYLDEGNPPCGLLEACHAMGRTDFRNCISFNSLSKRSSLPGLRSGFVAGDAAIIRAFLLYRTYHGSAMPPAAQTLSLLAWQDEEHVIANRRRYRRKFDRAFEILQGHLDIHRPEGGFYLWMETPVDDTEFVRQLYAEQQVTLLPGSFLARTVDGSNPGRGYARIALVPEEKDCEEALVRLVRHLEKY